MGELLSVRMAVNDAAAAGKELAELTIQVTIKSMAFHVSGYGQE